MIKSIIPKVAYPVGLLVITVVFLIYGWIGVIDSDDLLYASGARGWLAEFPFLGETHWALRHTYVLPLAGVFSIFGISEASLVSVSISYYLAAVVVAWLLLIRHFTPAQAFVACVILVSTPLFAVYTTIPGPDITEAFFILLSFYLFDAALNTDRRTGLLILAGVAAAAAWITRETAIGLMLFYGILFLVGYGLPRKQYLWIVLGMAVPVLVELLWYFIETGDLLYRLWVDIDQGKSKGIVQAPQGTGNIEIGYLVNPLLALLFNQEFAVVYFAFVPAAIWVWRTTSLNSDQKRMLVLLVGLGLVLIISIGYIVPVRKLPRYFEAATLIATLVVGLWISVSLFSHSRIIALFVAVVILSANLLGIYVDNKQPLFGERALVEWAAENRKIVYTDKETARKARFFLETRGLEQYVRVGIPDGEAVYLYNLNRHTLDEGIPTAWQEIVRIDPGRKLVGRLLEALGLDSLIPASVYKKLNAPYQAVLIFRTDVMTH